MKRTLRIAMLLVGLTAFGCSCPPVGGSSGRGSRDSSDVTFAFFGGLRCLFGESKEPATEESRQIAESDLTSKDEKKAAAGPHTAALTIR